MYDAIVVGARCAGSPTALLLGRKGYRVLLVDKTSFPSDTMSTHYIHQPGLALLARWGLLDRLIASGCPPVSHFTFDVGPIVLAGEAPAADGVTDGRCPRRTVLDHLLVQAAVEASVELREGFTVQELLWEEERVVGIRGTVREGAQITEHARIVIGADGLHSAVAKAVQAPTSHEVSPLECVYYTYWSGVPMAGAELYPRPGRVVFGFPTHDDLTILGVGWPHQEFHAYRSDIEGNYLKTLELVPQLYGRVRAGRREERFVGTADLPNFLRKPYGAGWALVGDAGYHKDPYTAQGITDAFRDAQLLAEAIDAGFAGRQSLEAALSAYEQQRNAVVLPMYELTCQLATLSPPPPQMQQLLAGLIGNQAETNRFFGTIAGTVPIPGFFAPEHVQQILAGEAPL